MTRKSKDAEIRRALKERPGWMPGIRARTNGDLHRGWPTPDHRGYGRVRIPGADAVALVHRVAWLAEMGPIPPGHVLSPAPDGCGSLSCLVPSECWVSRPWIEA